MGAVEEYFDSSFEPTNVLYYRVRFAIKPDETDAEARKKIIKILKEFGIENIAAIGHERFVSNLEVQEKAFKVLSSESITSREGFKPKSNRAKRILANGKTE